MKKKAPIIIIVVLIIIVVIGMMLYSDNIKSNKDSSESTESLSESELEQEAPTVEDNTQTGEVTPNSQGFIIMDEDADGDGILTRAEAKADGWPYHKLCYNDDGSNTTYLVDIRTGQIIHPGDSFVNENGMLCIWYGTTQEDIESVEGKVVE